MIKECPVDCSFSVWTEWGACSEPCDEGLKTRTRFEETAARFGGFPCEGELTKQATCVFEPCPVDCVMNPWEDDAQGCSKSCGGGDLVQHRTVQTAQVGTGAACPEPVNFELLQAGNGHVRKKDDGSQSRTIKCNIDACPVDCAIEEEWKAEGSCSKSCGGGTLISRKAITVLNANGGVECPAADSAERYKSEDCNTEACPVDCVVSQWTGWGGCSTSCGEGTRTRTRSIETEMADGGIACPSEEELSENEACTLVECPIHCVVGDWGSWGTAQRSAVRARRATAGKSRCRRSTAATLARSRLRRTRTARTTRARSTASSPSGRTPRKAARRAAVAARSSRRGR